MCLRVAGWPRVFIRISIARDDIYIIAFAGDAVAQQQSITQGITTAIGLELGGEILLRDWWAPLYVIMCITRSEKIVGGARSSSAAEYH